MLIFLAILCLMPIIVFIHEMGHFLAYRNYGILATKVNVGLPLPFVSKSPKLSMTIKGVEFCIHPIFLFGSIDVDPEEREKVPSYLALVWMMTAGSFANTLAAGILYLLCVACGIVSISNVETIALTVAIVALTIWRKQFYAYVFPVIAIFIYMLGIYIVLHPLQVPYIQDIGPANDFSSWRFWLELVIIYLIVASITELVAIAPADGATVWAGVCYQINPKLLDWLGTVLVIINLTTVLLYVAINAAA